MKIKQMVKVNIKNYYYSYYSFVLPLYVKQTNGEGFNSYIKKK